MRREAGTRFLALGRMVVTTACCLPAVILEETGPDEETYHITKLGMP